MAGGVHGRGGMHGRGACMVGACVAGGHVWQGGMCGRGACVAGGHVWWGACMAGGMHAMDTPPPTPQDTVSQCAGGMHPTGMYSCLLNVNGHESDIY